jgi:NAD(P)-dependent dehydrogenase (short-subunit alcohol dehydrogenase family)
MRLEGKVALITGAGRGIGAEVARAMAREGARVVVCDIDRSVAEEVAAGLGDALAVAGDIGDAAAVEAMMAEAVRRFGRIDILVNNAGIGILSALLDMRPADWERVIRINLTGTFLCSQAAARVMKDNGYGRIIAITSTSGQRGGTGRGAYGASKAGVELMTKVLAMELAPFGINANAIAPGPVLTELARATHTEETTAIYRDRIPLRRYAEPKEIAAAAVFLASSEADFITGHTLNVDGGFNAAGLLLEQAPDASMRPR